MLNWKSEGKIQFAATLFGTVRVKPVVRESDGKEFGYLLMPGDSIWADFDSVDEAINAANKLCNFPV
jgi:hypothetical protein